MQNENDPDIGCLSDEQMASTVFRLVETIVELIEIAKVDRGPYEQLIGAAERVHRQILVGPPPRELEAAKQLFCDTMALQVDAAITEIERGITGADN